MKASKFNIIDNKREVFKFTLLIILLFCLFSNFTVFNNVTSVKAEEGLEKYEVITLEEVLRSAMEENADVRGSKLDQKIAELDQKSARKGRHPELSITSSITRLSENPQSAMMEGFGEMMEAMVGFPMPDDDFDKGAMNQYNTQISLQQPLYMGGRIGLGIELADMSRNLTGLQARQTVNEVMINIIESYYNLILAQERVEIEREALEIVREQRRLAEAAYDAGTALKTDVLQAEIEEANAYNSLQEAEDLLELARKALKNTAGINSSEFKVVKPAFRPEIDLEEEIIYQKVHESSLQLEMLDINSSLLSKNLEMEKRSKYPNILLNGSYSWQSDEFSFEDGSWNITLALAADIFDSGRSRIEQEKIENQLEKLEEQKSSAAEMIELNIEGILKDIDQSRERVELQNLQIERARENLNLQQKRYEAGMGRNIEVLSAQTMLKQAQLGLIQAEQQYNLNLYSLLNETDSLFDFYEGVIKDEN